MPRGIAVRLLRLQGCKVVRNDDGSLSDEASSALTDTTELELDEANAIVRRHFQHRADLFNPALWFEALFGPDALLELIVPMLEALSDESLAAPLINDPEGYYAGRTAPLLLRAEAKRGKAFETRLKALLRRCPKSALADWQSFAHVLGLSVGGAAFIREHAYRVDDRVDEISLLWADDDPDFVRSQLVGAPPGPPYLVYPHLVFVGGDEVIDNYQSALQKGKDAATQPNAVRTFGLMRSERAMQLLLWMATTSKAKQEASDWFVAHPNETRAFLEQASKKKNAEGKSALALLAGMKGAKG